MTLKKSADGDVLDQLGPVIRRLPSGRFKVYWSWSTAKAFGLGPNFRYAVARGQPTAGFDTVDKARAFERSLPKAPAEQLGVGYNIPERDFSFCLKCGNNMYSPLDHRCMEARA